MTDEPTNGATPPSGTENAVSADADAARSDSQSPSDSQAPSDSTIPTQDSRPVHESRLETGLSVLGLASDALSRHDEDENQRITPQHARMSRDTMAFPAFDFAREYAIPADLMPAELGVPDPEDDPNDPEVIATDEKDGAAGGEELQPKAEQSTAGQSTVGQRSGTQDCPNPSDHVVAEAQKDPSEGNDGVSMLTARIQDVTRAVRAAQVAESYRQPAQDGDDKAQVTLADMLALGVGVTQDDHSALQWYRKAADQHNAAAQNALAIMLFRGDGGVDPNPRQAAILFHSAAESGDACAQANLGLLYDAGKGVRRDVKKAAHWFTKAASCGIAVA